MKFQANNIRKSPEKVGLSLGNPTSPTLLL